MVENSSDIEIKIKSETSDAESGVERVEKKARSLGDVLKGELGARGGNAIGALADVIQSRFLVALGVAGAAAFTLKKGLDLTIEAEKAEQAARSFDAIASSLRVSSDEIKAGLMSAANEMADDDDLLSAASRGMMSLEESAGRIPEVMDIARKATVLYGGELLANFEALNSALASGRVGALKQYGIIVDAEKAIKEYARSLGVSASVLTESGKKQAVLNAALNEANTKFSAIDESSLKASTSLTQLKVSFQQLYGATAEAAQNSGFFASTMNIIKDSINGYAELIKGKLGNSSSQMAYRFNEAGLEIRELESEIASLTKRLENSQGLDRSTLLNSLTRAQTRLSEVRKEWAGLNDDITNSELSKQKSGQFVLMSAQNKAKKSDSVDMDALNRLRAQYDQTLLQIRQSKIASDEQILSLGKTRGSSELQIESLNQAKIQLIRDEYALKEKALREQNKQDSILGSASLNETLKVMEEEKKNRILQIQQEESDQKRQIRRKEIENDPNASMSNIVEMFRMQSEEMKDIAAQTASSIRGAFVNGFSNAFSALGKGLATGKNGFEEFGKSVLSTLGGLAIQLGQFFMLVGAGMTGTGSLLGMSGAAAIAAGVGLTVLGGVLQGLGGGGSTASSGGGSGDQSTSVPEVEPQKPKTEVHVNIQGSVFDTRETGMRITEVLGEFFRTNDGRVVTVV